MALPVGLEHLTADGDRLGRYLREGDDARHRALVHPVVDGAPLHQHVASLEVHAGAIPLLFDYLVGANPQCGRDFDAKGFGSLEVNDKLDVGRKFDW